MCYHHEHFSCVVPYDYKFVRGTKKEREEGKGREKVRPLDFLASYMAIH